MIAMASKTYPSSVSEVDLRKQRRDELETDLVFVGFAVNKRAHDQKMTTIKDTKRPSKPCLAIHATARCSTARSSAIHNPLWRSFRGRCTRSS